MTNNPLLKLDKTNESKLTSKEKIIDYYFEQGKSITFTCSKFGYSFYDIKIL